MVRKAAHDLRAPVRLIKSFAGFLLEDLGPAATPKTTHDVENILQGVERLQVLIDGLSDLALVSAKPVESAPIPLDSGLPIGGESRISAVSDPPPLVLADSELLGMLWRHLLLATQKLSLDAAEPSLAVECASNAEVALVATVRRSAFGLKEVRRAFEPFPVHPGHPHDPGASLAICRRAAERMGGSAAVEATVSGALLLVVRLLRPFEESVSN